MPEKFISGGHGIPGGIRGDGRLPKTAISGDGRAPKVALHGSGKPEGGIGGGGSGRRIYMIRHKGGKEGGIGG